MILTLFVNEGKTDQYEKSQKLHYIFTLEIIS